MISTKQALIGGTLFLAMALTAQAQWVVAFQDRSKQDLNVVHFADARFGWVVGDNGIVHVTQDGGKESAFYVQISQIVPPARHDDLNLRWDELPHNKESDAANIRQTPAKQIAWCYPRLTQSSVHLIMAPRWRKSGEKLPLVWPTTPSLHRLY